MIYADYNGSTPLCSKVQEFLVKRLQEGGFSNPNSTHALGKRLMFAMEKSRRVLANSLGCKSPQIVFNSGSSEGITQIFHSVLGLAPKNEKNIIITSGIEHAAVVQCCALFEKRGYEVITLKTKNDGVVNLAHLEEILKAKGSQVAMVTCMAANNENGIIQPFKEIGKLSHDHGTIYFSDTTQYIGKTKFNFAESNMDYAVSSSHKIGALIGSGLIISKVADSLSPLILGGGQERGIRGGTQNYIAIETMGIAMDSFDSNIEHLKTVNELRLRFEKNIKKKFPKVVIIGEDSPRLATTTMIAYPGIIGQHIQIELEAKEIYVTTSSACSDKKVQVSRVLQAMGTDEEVGLSVVRISLCMNANQELYNNIEAALSDAYNKHKAYL